MVEGSLQQFVHALAPRQGPPALHARRDDRRPLRSGCSDIGERDTQLQLLRAATDALPPIDKAHKWFVTRGDLDYTALWILYAATPLAQIEVIGAGRLADREVIPQALKLNPAFFTIDLHRPAQHEEDARRPCRRRSTRSTATWPSGRRRCSRRCSTTCARRARRGRAREIEEHFKRTLRRRGRDDGLRVPGRSGAHRQGVDARPPHEEEQCRGAGAGVLLPRRRRRTRQSDREGQRARSRGRARARPIAVQGARVHNLKNISLEIPRDSLIVVTGLSGSGKSSLAFDTIYAEGQRRYMESLSSYRQALRRAGGQARRRLRVRPVAGDLDRAEDAREQPALDRRHDDRHRELPEPAVRDDRRSRIARAPASRRRAARRARSSRRSCRCRRAPRSSCARRCSRSTARTSTSSSPRCARRAAAG